MCLNFVFSIEIVLLANGGCVIRIRCSQNRRTIRYIIALPVRSEMGYGRFACESACPSQERVYFLYTSIAELCCDIIFCKYVASCSVLVSSQLSKQQILYMKMSKTPSRDICSGMNGW